MAPNRPSDEVTTATHQAIPRRPAAGSSPDPPAARPAPAVTAPARFRILREHARGGLGQILVARDEQLGREVALKEIQPQSADDLASRNRFLLEAEVTGNLEHPGFVPVYALGRYADGRPFYTMRLIRGESLKEAIARLNARNGRPSTPDPREQRALIRRLIDVCNAMAYAHNRGVIHRDLKPANILLGPYGETLVVDWGLAKILALRPQTVPTTQNADAASSRPPTAERPAPTALGSHATKSSTAADTPRKTADALDSTAAEAPTQAAPGPDDSPAHVVHTHLGRIGDQLTLDAESSPLFAVSGSGEGHTLPGHAIGTPAYMSPEQAAGDHEKLGPATDIYSLGATLYCILTGKPPFGESSDVPEVLDRVQHGAFPAPRALAGRVEKPLEAICLKAMALRPEDRYPSMTELAQDLENFLADEPVSAHREPWYAKLARWSRRHKAWAISATGALLAVVAILSATAEGFRRSAERERAAREHGLRVAAKFAARTVAAEIDRRWRILEDEADEPRLIALIQQAADTPFDSPQHRALQEWLERRFSVHQNAAAASNWFLTDAQGRQIARVPLIERGIGVNYAFRDYFHGQGRDLPEGTQDVRPLNQPHRSIVFQSKNTGRYTVVFSVPVFDAVEIHPLDPHPPRPTVLGVLGMSVDVGRFGVLQLDVGDTQIAVLADLREDETGRDGLILHHPGIEAAGAQLAMTHLRPEQRRSLEELRNAAREWHRARFLGLASSSPQARTSAPPAQLRACVSGPAGRRLFRYMVGGV